jgi:hypothetical protein
MSFDSLGRWTPNHKVSDHYGHLIPDVEYCEGERPHFPFAPASWLPVQFYDRHFENWNVIMPGKIVTLDPDGRVIPAEYGLTSASVTYSANDVTAGVIDVSTGAAVTSAKTVTLSDIDGSTYGFMGRSGKSFNDSVVKYPIGVMPYAALQWAGDASSFDDGWNPAGLRQHNYNMQHQIAVLCDFVLRLPLIPGQKASETVNGNWTAATITFGTKGWHNRTYVRSTARYSSTGYLPVLATDTVVALALDNTQVAKNTTRTPITSNLSGLLVTEVGSVSAVSSSGYFFVDYEVGVVFVYAADGQTLPAVVPGTTTVTYYHTASVPATYSSFACVLADTTLLAPGDFLKCGTASNFVRATPASDNANAIIGQVLGFETHPRGGLEMVRTAFNPAIGTDSSGTMSAATAGSASVNLGQLDQMPGSATAGYPDSIHYAGAADTNVIINLINR